MAHTAALAAIVRATNGNFRLADHLVTQIKRVLDINGHTHLAQKPSTPPKKRSSSDAGRRDKRDNYRRSSQMMRVLRKEVWGAEIVDVSRCGSRA